ncbi:YtxH domain-containing protein [[Brevibacterium] frigoritolerans]|uniref:YtxH domain-containing protein n=1 Tax=Peribacillus frigoritolerans TaxID=450367 RepID=A0A941JBE1_9BACI|nr:YtxH domain-containing protein [Peribacillus frigoritolerans]
MKAKSLLIGFLTGTVVAGAATLLSTPSSGKDLRTRIKTNTDEIKATIDELKVKCRILKMTRWKLHKSAKKR